MVYFSKRACYFALLLSSNGPNVVSESINLIMNYPLSMWQGQFNIFSLLTVQKQIQYHCIHKVQDSENTTKHLEAIAARVDKN